MCWTGFCIMNTILFSYHSHKKNYIGKRLTKLYRKSHLGLIHGGEGGVAKMNACIIIFFFTQKYINIVRLWSYGVPKYYIAFVYPSSFEVLLGIAHAIWHQHTLKLALTAITGNTQFFSCKTKNKSSHFMDNQKSQFS